MIKSRTEFAKRNIIFGLLNKLVMTVIPFIIRTAVIYKLGADYLGLNSLFSAILQTFNVVELGFSSAIVFNMYKPFAENNFDKVRSLLAFYRKVYRTIGISILVVGLCLLPFLRLLIKGDVPDDVNIHYIYIFFLSGTVISYLGVAYKASLLSVAQRQDIISNIDTILGIFRSLLQLGCILLFNNFYLYVLCIPLFNLLYNIVIANVSKRKYPEYYCEGTLTKEELQSIKKQIKGLALGKIGLVSRNSMDSIALSMFCGLIDVTVYANYYLIFTSVSAILLVVIQAILGSVGNSIAVESQEKNYKDFGKFNFAFVAITSLFSIFMLCLYHPFMEFWVGKDLSATSIVEALFCIYFFIVHIGQIRAVYSSAAGLWWEFRYLQIAESILNPILNFGLGYIWGMKGILLATIITVFSFSIIGIGKKTVNLCFNRSSIEYFIVTFKYSLLTLIAAFISYTLCYSMLIDNVIAVLFVRSLVVIVVFLIVYGFFVVTNKTHLNYTKELYELLKRK